MPSDFGDYKPAFTSEQVLREMKTRRKVPVGRTRYEEIRQYCIQFVEEYGLKSGEAVRIGKGMMGILDVMISKLTARELRNAPLGLQKGHRYFVSITSSVRGTISHDILG